MKDYVKVCIEQLNYCKVNKKRRMYNHPNSNSLRAIENNE